MAQTTLRTKNEDGDDVTHTFHLEDEHAEDEVEALESLATRAEERADLQAELKEKEGELDTAREALVGEIVRRKKLAGELEEDGVEEERDFLSGLPMDRLKTHYDRALKLEVDTESATDLDADPPSGNDGSKYEEKGLV